MTFSVTEKRGTSRNIFTGRTFSARQNTNVPLENSLESRPHSPPRQTSIPCVCRTVPDQAVFEPIRLPAEKTPVVFPSREKKKRGKKKSLWIFPFSRFFFLRAVEKCFTLEEIFSLSGKIDFLSLSLSLHLHRFVSVLQTMAQLSLPPLPRFLRL